MSSNTLGKKKRFRAVNFTAEEVRLLIRLALKEKHILENKQTDSEVWKLKTKTWEKIAEGFNASSGQTFRSVDTLRLKYDGLKKDLKKKVIKNKAETMKTGGGKPDYIIIDGPEKELLEILSLSVHGLPSLVDSDSILPHTKITGEKSNNLLNDVPITEEEIETYDLPVVIEVTDVSTDGNHEVVIAEGDSVLDTQHSTESIVKNIEDKKPHEIASGTGAWKEWSPAALKAKKHPLLTPKKKKGNDKNKKIENLLGLREELVRAQIYHTEQEERRAQEKHKKEMKLLDLKIEIKEKKL